MIDLHTHSIFSDGELIPSELVRRLEFMGYSAVAITDHVDSSNFDFIIPRILQVSEDLNIFQTVKVVPGVELTHVPPRQISSLVAKARDLGAKLVLVHGETIAEPVAPDTNLAAIEAGADILAHPGMISEKESKMAAEGGVFLEISARKGGHSFTNGHVARLAVETGASLILNSDAHGPGDFMTREFASRVAEGAGLPSGALKSLLDNSRRLLRRIGYTL
ncbi:MAG: histidinol phosphate phosphatase domain-containing protein [Desulfatiglandales bacterium]